MLGVELTATPVVESGTRSVPFQNVILDYPVGRAMADGFVKEPAVVTRKDFNPAGMSAEAVERLKLEDAIRLHEQTKVLLETYARVHDVDVLATQAAAVTWCQRASAHAATCGGKPWENVLLPHDAIAANMTLPGLVRAFSLQPE